MHSLRLVVFDIAGTIVEDRGEVLHAFGKSLDRHGFRYTHDELKEWKGASKREVIRHFVEAQRGGSDGEKEVAAVYADFRCALEAHYREKGVAPIAGAAESFAWLRQHDIRIATTSGFYREVSTLVLELAGWAGMFDASISSSDVAMGRPAPFMIFRAMEAAGVMNVREVVNVGDTPLDLQAGTNAGVREVIGVLTGLHGKDRLRQEPHTALLSSVGDLPAWIEKQCSVRSRA
jgi:phosphonatase-like hydrolase